jgi:hypothetical protein
MINNYGDDIQKSKVNINTVFMFNDENEEEVQFKIWK